MQRKTGKLSNEAIQFITENSAKLTPEVIAAHIGKSTDTVARYIEKNNLIKFAISFEEKVKNEIQAQLYSEPFWVAIKDNYTDKECKIFEEIWIEIVRQFENDVTATEKLQIHKYLTLFLQRERSVARQTVHQKMLNGITDAINLEKQKAPEERSSALIDKLARTMVEMTNEAKNIAKEIKELSEQESKIEASLKGTRDQRIQKIADASKNWSSIVGMLESSKVRRDLGRHIEIHRIAADKARAEISKPMQFDDKSVSIPLLNSSTIESLNLED